ncbi:Unknown protein sequence [Pseudomonas syringae pv. maculicola]|nr:Unknown protein sequence [Pseudomonas syringae pv. maculicola]
MRHCDRLRHLCKNLYTIKSSRAIQLRAAQRQIVDFIEAKEKHQVFLL